MRFARMRMAAVAALAGAGAAQAHHSPAAFDESAELVYEGVITRVAWKNPFVSLTLQTSDADGAPASQTIEGASVRVLGGLGVTLGMLIPGERVTVRGYQSRLGKERAAFGIELIRQNGASVPLSRLPAATQDEGR